MQEVLDNPAGDCAKPMPTIVRIKREAKQIKKKEGCIHARALDLAVQAHGFSNYKHYLNAIKAGQEPAEMTHG